MASDQFRETERAALVAEPKALETLNAKLQRHRTKGC